MIIMIVFLILSILLVIATAIYLKHKKNTKNRRISQDKKKTSKVKSKKQLSDIFKIQIKDNIISLNGRYSVVLKLGNIDYTMLSDHEQDLVENVLVQVALAIDYPVQFFSTTEFIDTSKIVSLIKQNTASNAKIQEYKDYLIDYLQNLMENRTISIIKNYAIISSDNAIYENAMQELNRFSSIMKKNLLGTKIVCEVLNESELYDLVYRELNKNSAITISPLMKGVDNLYVTKKEKQRKKEYKHF